jgi:hypothetical protein
MFTTRFSVWYFRIYRYRSVDTFPGWLLIIDGIIHPAINVSALA